MKKSKIKIISICPTYFEATSPNLKKRFEMMSQQTEGHVFATTTEENLPETVRFGSFRFHPLKFYRNKLIRNSNYYLQTMIKVMRLKKAEDFDIIAAYDPLMYGILAVFLKSMTGKPVVLEINGHLKKDAFLENETFPLKLKRRAFEYIVKRTIKAADHLKMLNPEQKEEWEEAIGEKNVSIFHNFVPTDNFEKRDSCMSNYILFVGYPYYRKGVDILIEAFKRIAHDYPDTKLRIIGHCPGGDAEQKKYLDMVAGIDNVEICRPVPYDEVMKQIENCRFFVLPSRSEAMGRVLLEAMAAGKAVVGSRVGGIQYIVEDGVNGYLFENENKEQLSLCMKKLLDDDELCKKMGNESVHLIEKRYSAQIYIDKYVDMLEKVVALNSDQ